MEEPKQIKELNLEMAPKLESTSINAMFTLNNTDLYVVSGKTFTMSDARKVWPELKHRKAEQLEVKSRPQKYGIFGKMSPLYCQLKTA